MKQHLEHFIQATIVQPDEKEIQALLNIFHLTVYQKGHLLKQHNDICTFLGFIISGSVRLYTNKKNGEKITGRVIQHNNFVTDLISARTGKKTAISIEILEPTSMLIASLEDVNQLLRTNLTFNKLMREVMANYIVQMGKLHLLFLNGTATERYRHMLETYPNMQKKLPLHFIAHMIGITPTQLSRIRKGIMANQF